MNEDDLRRLIDAVGLGKLSHGAASTGSWPVSA